MKGQGWEGDSLKAKEVSLNGWDEASFTCSYRKKKNTINIYKSPAMLNNKTKGCFCFTCWTSQISMTLDASKSNEIVFFIYGKCKYIICIYCCSLQVEKQISWKNASFMFQTHLVLAN
jgi:hypothetical protein